MPWSPQFTDTSNAFNEDSYDSGVSVSDVTRRTRSQILVKMRPYGFGAQGSPSTWQGDLKADFISGQNQLGPQPSFVQPHQSDMEPTRFSHRLLRFFSWRPDPEAEATAFFQDWRTYRRMHTHRGV